MGVRARAGAQQAAGQKPKPTPTALRTTRHAPAAPAHVAVSVLPCSPRVTVRSLRCAPGGRPGG
eukprot:163795-Chlamydomonas_euryale.AAC.1